MISGYFENCYGIKQLQLAPILFNQCNKAVIYAPNGVMKTSFSKVFEDISKGVPTSDRIFKHAPTAYSITHYSTTHTFSAENPHEIPHSDFIYVINSFADKFEFTKETVSTLLADEATRNKYNVIAQRLKKLCAKSRDSQLDKFLTLVCFPSTSDFSIKSLNK